MVYSRYTEINISEETHSKLVNVGKYGESTDDIVSRLIDGYKDSK